MLVTLAIFCMLGIVVGHDRPIIGILTMEPHLLEPYFSDVNYKTYISASYVKFVECGGARVMPVWLGRNKKYYKDIVAKTNAILLPGGGANLSAKDGFRDAALHLYKAAVERNNAGDYYPIFGICLGMEMIIQASHYNKDIRSRCMARNMSLPLEFVNGYKTSKLFSKASCNMIDLMKSTDVSFNMHRYCLTRENLALHGLDETWKVLSTNKDIHGEEFISSYEHVNYPFYGLQFHPEKMQYEFKSDLAIAHFPAAIEIGQYFSNFLVAEARKSCHSFDDLYEEMSHLIYNYAPKYASIVGSVYEQAYVFSEEQNMFN